MWKAKINTFIACLFIGFITWLRCKIGKHDWVTSVRAVSFNGTTRFCLNCDKKQYYEYNRDDTGRWRAVKRKW